MQRLTWNSLARTKAPRSIRNLVILTNTLSKINYITPKYQYKTTLKLAQGQEVLAGTNSNWLNKILTEFSFKNIVKLDADSRRCKPMSKRSRQPIKSTSMKQITSWLQWTSRWHINFERTREIQTDKIFYCNQLNTHISL